MHALYIVVPVLCILAIAYRYYSAFIAAKVMMLDDTRVTPAHSQYDGHNYYPTKRWVLFGHHFAAISGAGPLSASAPSGRCSAVRSAFHPDHHRCGDARRPLPGAGIRRARVAAVRKCGLAPRIDHLDHGGCRRVGLLHLDRQHQHHLADVRHRQPVARGRGARRGHDRNHQCRPCAVCLDYADSALVRRDQHARGRIHERARQLLAHGDGIESILGEPGVCELHLHRDHDGLRRDHSHGRPTPLAARCAAAHRGRDRAEARSAGIIDDDDQQLNVHTALIGNGSNQDR